MKFLFDFFPILAFFLAYKFSDIMVATGVAIAATLMQLLWTRFKTGIYPKVQLISFFIILLFGGATLLLKNELYVKWKPTVIYWLLSLILALSHRFGKKPFMQRLGESSISLPKRIWSHLNASWAIFFFLLGALNIYVIYHFDTDTWVNFKLFGTLGLTLAFVIGQSIIIARHMHVPNGNANSN